jgi:short-subunit dehydrogenase
MRVEPRTILISGAASGIGKQLALSLAGEGHRLMLLDINEAALTDLLAAHGLQDGARIATRRHDVRDAAGWDAVVAETVQRFGALDVMLNVAGCLAPGYVQALTADAIDRQLDINVKGVMHATRAGAVQMLAQGHGHIVNMASIAGISHVPGMSVYCASKHAVRGFSLSVAHELLSQGVHVTVVCPDAVDTPMLSAQVAHPEAAMTFGAGASLAPEDVVKAVLRALRDRPLELVLPVPRSGRGVLAKLANMFPELGKYGVERVRAQGRRAQAARKQRESA